MRADPRLGRSARLDEGVVAPTAEAPQPDEVDKQLAAPGVSLRSADGEVIRSAVDTTCDPAGVPLDGRFKAEPDRSWDRKFLPFGLRRSLLHFFSRARRLVFHEEPWGHRQPFLHDNELAFWGSFKTPTLRNVSLTGPYMRNGRLKNLPQVIAFYHRGGDVRLDLETNPDKDPAITAFERHQEGPTGDAKPTGDGLLDEDGRALWFFLLCLTDPRVEREQAPFDHPSLVVANGYDEHGGVLGGDQIIDVDEVGAAGIKNLPNASPSGNKVPAP